MIALDRISIRAGHFALTDISFHIEDSIYAALMGPTGSGKTTLLEVICGLRKPLAGRVLIDGQDVTRASPGSRGIGYVPQDGALFPTMSIRRQIGFAPSLRRWSRADINHRVDELADHLGITHLLDRLPLGFSGGERQRVAVGRALAVRPAALLLDEPLSALDQQMRGGLAELLKRTQREESVSVLHVTHDRAEADKLADVQFSLSRTGVMSVMR